MLRGRNSKLIKHSPWHHGIHRIERRTDGWGKGIWGKAFTDKNRDKLNKQTTVTINNDIKKRLQQAFVVHLGRDGTFGWFYCLENEFCGFISILHIPLIPWFPDDYHIIPRYPFLAFKRVWPIFNVVLNFLTFTNIEPFIAYFLLVYSLSFCHWRNGSSDRNIPWLRRMWEERRAGGWELLMMSPLNSVLSQWHYNVWFDTWKKQLMMGTPRSSI